MDEMVRPSADNPDVQHETTDVAVKPILYSALGLFAVIVLCFVIMYALFRAFDQRVERSKPPPVSLVKPATGMAPPAPRLQRLNTAPILEMQQLRAREELILSTYGVRDPRTGIVRIPIDQAMRLTLERGLPVRTMTASPPPAAASSIGAETSAAKGQSSTVPVSDKGYAPQAMPRSNQNEVVEPTMPAPSEGTPQ